MQKADLDDFVLEELFRFDESIKTLKLKGYARGC